MGLDEASSALRDVLVTAVTQPADEVLSFTLRGADGDDLEAWTPGAHIDLVLPSGLIRQYSLCGDPGTLSSYRIAVLREKVSRGGSAELHDTALVGRRLKIRGPRNHFALEPAQQYLFIAGGIGITPLFPMIGHVDSQAGRWQLVYGGRTRSSMAFLSDLDEMARGRLRVVAQDEVGLPDLAQILGETAPGTGIYACGPPGLLSAVEASCRDLGLTDALHLERFGAASESAAAPLGGPDRAFEVELRSTGRVLSVPADRTLLDVVRDVLPDTLSSCEEGFCGTCETRVLGGLPDHRDTILSPAEREANTVMMICVGRSLTARLVLDR